MANFVERMIGGIKHGWNVFQNNTFAYEQSNVDYGRINYGPPGRVRTRFTNEKTIIASIYTRLSIDVSGVNIRHVRTDNDGQYLNDIGSTLQDCLTVDPNLDQGPRQFRQDIAMSLFERGVVAIVPVDTSIDPAVSDSFIINSMRVGEVMAWSPSQVQVRLYDERDGITKDIWVAKRTAAIVENPLYAVMNEYNSTLQRLIRKLNLLDSVDEQSSSGKLDLIIQLPYVIKSDARKQQAEQRRADIETQLKGSQYGVAYTDGTEKITQLNRPVENNLLKQIEYLTAQLYIQLGLTVEVMNGTADEKSMINYFNRTVEPVVQAITEAMKRSFLTKTARTQNQSITYFRDPFHLVPMSELADIVDKFSRNEVLSANEIRQGIGYKPSSDPKANQLINSNMPQPQPQPALPPPNYVQQTAVPSVRQLLAIESGGDSQNGT
jgi:hypothetical protein